MPVKFGSLSSIYGRRSRYVSKKTIKIEKPKKVKTKRKVCSYCKRIIQHDDVYLNGKILHRACKKEIEDM